MIRILLTWRLSSILRKKLQYLHIWVDHEIWPEMSFLGQYFMHKFYALSRTRTTKLWFEVKKKTINNNNENYKVHCVDLMNKENGLFSSNERVILEIIDKEIICYLMNNSYNFLVSKIVNSIYLYLKEWRNRRKMSKSKHHKSCEEINLYPQATVNRTRNLLPTSLARAISPIW